MLTAIRGHLPTVTLFPPQGGLFIWLKLPEGISSSTLLSAALKAGVEFAPGTRFFINPAEGEPYLRLNFASRTPQEIETGIQRLGQVFEAV
jgi:GntR family transcriptional regulator / MocR family aminotransferase